MEHTLFSCWLTTEHVVHFQFLAIYTYYIWLLYISNYSVESVGDRERVIYIKIRVEIIDAERTGTSLASQISCIGLLWFRGIDEDKQRKLEEQRKNNVYHRFVEGNLILKQGFLDKRKVCCFLFGYAFSMDCCKCCVVSSGFVNWKYVSCYCFVSHKCFHDGELYSIISTTV